MSFGQVVTWLMNSRVELVNDSRESSSADSANFVVMDGGIEHRRNRTCPKRSNRKRGLVPTNFWCGSVLAVWRDGSKKYS